MTPPFNKKPLKIYFLLVSCFFLVLAMALTGDKPFQFLRYVDKHILAESLKDIQAFARGAENWHTARKTRTYNYEWLENTIPPLRIAHGLGGKQNANSLEAYRQSRQRGFVFFEVDIWKDEQGVLRCHHGPTPPPPLHENGCTLPRLLSERKAEEFIILDVKTDFFSTGEKIIRLLKRSPHSEKIIFQLYHPDHIKYFSMWSDEHPLLPGPIVTAYRSRHSLNHVHEATKNAGIRAFTFPLIRLPALTKRSPEIVLFTHPVGSCAEMENALSQGVQGVYIKNDLDCKDKEL